MNGLQSDMNIDEAYQNLGMEVCEKAVDDYKKALKYNLVSTIRALEKFFRSGWFVFLCNDIVSGEDVIREVRSQWEKTLRRY